MALVCAASRGLGRACAEALAAEGVAVTITGRDGDSLNGTAEDIRSSTGASVRVAIGEAYGLPAGENVLDKLVTALKIMGADEVYDTIFGADLTVREESAEFLRRLETGENLPLMTSSSCCITYCIYSSTYYSEFLPL